jgi:hypothetical protein
VRAEAHFLLCGCTCLHGTRLVGEVFSPVLRVLCFHPKPSEIQPRDGVMSLMFHGALLVESDGGRAKRGGGLGDHGSLNGAAEAGRHQTGLSVLGGGADRSSGIWGWEVKEGGSPEGWLQLYGATHRRHGGDSCDKRGINKCLSEDIRGPVYTDYMWRFLGVCNSQAPQLCPKDSQGQS